MKIRDVPPRLQKYLHPVYRTLALRKKRKHRMRRTEVMKIRKKYVYFFDKPRIAPLLCSRCGLSTRKLLTILLHDCSLRPSSNWRGIAIGDFNDIDEDQLIKASQNKLRDGLAILEGTPRPQIVNLGSTIYSRIEDDTSPCCSTVERVPKLRDLLLFLLTPTRKARMRVGVDAAFERQSIKVVSRRVIGRGTRHGQVCTVCRKIFASFADYDNHLREGGDDSPCSQVPPDPIPILVNDHANLPAEYDLDRRVSRKVMVEVNVGECTACAKGGFTTRAQLHQHILACAKDIAAKAIIKRKVIN